MGAGTQKTNKLVTNPTTYKNFPRIIVKKKINKLTSTERRKGNVK